MMFLESSWISFWLSSERSHYNYRIITNSAYIVIQPVPSPSAWAQQLTEIGKIHYLSIYRKISNLMCVGRNRMVQINASAPGPDKLSWSHLKIILKDNECLGIIIRIANACIELGYWPSHFKRSMTVVIPKPNKKSYDSPKSFRPIVLLNTVGKLIKKVIRERLQFTMAANDFIHPSQLGGLKFKSMTDADIALTHIIQTGWVKNLSTSTLTFDIAQFFPLLNHHLLTLIMKKAGFDNRIVSFFANYLIDRKTNYFWNNFMSPIFNVNVGVGQGSVLSPILSALYLSPFIYILENQLKKPKNPDFYHFICR